METNEVNKKALEKLGTNETMYTVGWIPAIGWICALSLLNEYIIAPYIIYYTGRNMPALNTTELATLLVTMLGFGGIKAVEKMKGANNL